MKHAVEMGSVAMLYSYIPSFVKIGAAIRTLMEGGIKKHRDTQPAW
jgi:hypothetical protein